MTLRIPGYPSTFLEAGYRVEYVEKEFDVSQNGRPKEVKFDIILNSISKNHSIACECKSGGTEAEQLLKYSQLQPIEMVRVGGVSSNDASSHSCDVTLVYNEGNRSRIEQEAVGYPFVHLSISNDPTVITQHTHDFFDDDLEVFFGSPIPYPAFVHEVFRVGSQTPLCKYVKLVAEELVSISLSGQEQFDMSQLAPNVVSLVPGLYPARDRVSNEE
jgi:hypothetical protein